MRSLDRLIGLARDLIWLDGFRTGAATAALVLLTLAIFAVYLRGRR